MCSRECGHEHRHLAQVPREQEQREQECEVVPAGGDVDDAECDVAEQRRTGSRARTRARGLERPDRLGLGEHALPGGGAIARDAREVEMRRRHVEQDAALERARAAGGARDPPAEVGPALRRGLHGDRPRGAGRIARAQLEMVRDVLRRGSAGSHVEHGIEREPRELEQRDPHLHGGARSVELPARVGDAARVRGSRRRRCERQRESDRGVLHGSLRLLRTRTSARARRSSR